MDRSDIDVILEARKILWGKDEKMSTQEDFTRLWNLASAEMREKLLAGQASQLVDVGTFSVARWRHGGRVVQSSPAFALSGRLVSKFGVREDRRWGAGGAPRLLTAASLAGASEQGLRGAARCLAALQDALRSCVATGYASLVFPGIGTLLVVRRVARMSFEQDFLDEFESRLKEAGGGAMLMPPSQQSKPPRRRRRRPPKLVMGPPPSVLARMADAAQSQTSPTDQPPSHGESSPQRRKTKRDPLSALKKQLRATKSGPSAAGWSGGGEGTCNLTSCSRHSRHAAKQEPHKVPELPSKQRRREQLEIAEFYRRQEREKVDKEGVMRLYKQDCEESLAKLVREEEAKERRRRTRLRQELQAQREALIASSEQMKTAKKDSDEVLFQFKATRFLTTSMCSG